MKTSASGRDIIKFMADLIFLFPPESRPEMKQFFIDAFVMMDKEVGLKPGMIDEIDENIDRRLDELDLGSKSSFVRH